MHRQNNYCDTVLIDSEDKDVYVQAAYISHQLPGQLLIKHKHSIFNCHEMLPSEVADIIIPFHIITGSDHTSGFFGQGKKSILEKLKRDPEARMLLLGVGTNITLGNEVKEKMKKFVVRKLYGEDVETCAQARLSKWRKLKKKSLALSSSR